MRIHMNLIFGTTEGGPYTFRVPNAIDNASASTVRDAMGRLIEANAIDTNGRGDISEIQAARLVRVSDSVFDVS